ncbi:MAG TPA: TetR family transcriptional regulator, partial [Pseudonocardia sp.]|nr:TetR family transcriptional regulator [Pseudonocardia sp.]
QIERTRRAILDAAVRALTRDSGATLAAVAAEAGVGRATVHRYFPQRADLVRALAEDAIDQLSRTIAACRLQEGPVPDALRRLAAAAIPLADEQRFLDVGPSVWDLPELAGRWYSAAAVVEDLVRRGRAEGVVRPDLPVAWVTDLILGAVWTAAESVRDGRIAPNDAAELVVGTLLDGVRPR